MELKKFKVLKESEEKSQGRRISPTECSFRNTECAKNVWYAKKLKKYPRIPGLDLLPLKHIEMSDISTR